MTIAVISMIRDNWGGSEELWAAMAEAALKEGHEVLHLSFEHQDIHPKMKRLTGLGLQEYHRVGFSGDDNITPLKKKWIIARNYLRKKLDPPFKKIFMHKPDIVLYVGTCFSIVGEKGLLRQVKKSRARFFMLSHYLPPVEERISDMQKDDARSAYQLAEKCFFTDKRTKSRTSALLGIPLHNAVYVRNPVNISSEAYIPFPKDPVIQFATVGNLVVEHKGQDLLLTVLSREAWLKRNWRLNIYGSGKDERRLKEYVAAHSLEDKVFFHGKQSDIRSVWEKNHLLIMPSRMEGIPLAMVEAMLCGRPSVATDVGGITEWIENGVEGFIAAAPVLDDLSNALEQAWSNRDHWSQMGQAAHEKAVKNHDFHAGNTLLDLIRP